MDFTLFFFYFCKERFDHFKNISLFVKEQKKKPLEFILMYTRAYTKASSRLKCLSSRVVLTVSFYVPPHTNQMGQRKARWGSTQHSRIWSDLIHCSTSSAKQSHRVRAYDARQSPIWFYPPVPVSISLSQNFFRPRPIPGNFPCFQFRKKWFLIPRAGPTGPQPTGPAIQNDVAQRKS